MTARDLNATIINAATATTLTKGHAPVIRTPSGATVTSDALVTCPVIHIDGVMLIYTSTTERDADYATILREMIGYMPPALRRLHP